MEVFTRDSVNVQTFFVNGVFHANISFGGTSMIIIAGVCTDIKEQLEAMTAVRNYKGILS